MPSEAVVDDEEPGDSSAWSALGLGLSLCESADCPGDLSYTVAVIFIALMWASGLLSLAQEIEWGLRKSARLRILTEIRSGCYLVSLLS